MGFIAIWVWGSKNASEASRKSKVLHSIVLTIAINLRKQTSICEYNRINQNENKTIFAYVTYRAHAIDISPDIRFRRDTQIMRHAFLKTLVHVDSPRSWKTKSIM